MENAVSRRIILHAAGVSGLAIGLGPFGSLPARAESAFTVACVGGSFGEGIKQAFIVKAGFEEKYKTKVSYAFDASTGVSLAKMMAKCGDPPFSVMYLLSADQNLAGTAGCLQDYDLDIVTNYKDIIPSTVAPATGSLKNWAAPCCIGAVGLLWNRKECSKPTSWMDMMNPKYKGRIGIPGFTWIGLNWMHAFNRSLGGIEANIDPAINALKALRQKNDAVFVANVDQAHKAIASGDLVMVPYWNGRTAELQEKGSEVDITYVPGSLMLRLAFVIPKGTAHPEAANRFIQNTLNGEFQLHLAERFRYPPTSRKVKLPASMERYAIPESVLESSMVELDWSTINKHRDAHLDRWNRELMG